jgi:hypothetical protein
MNFLVDPRPAEVRQLHVPAVNFGIVGQAEVVYRNYGVPTELRV